MTSYLIPFLLGSHQALDPVTADHRTDPQETVSDRQQRLVARGWLCPAAGHCTVRSASMQSEQTQDSGPEAFKMLPLGVLLW